MRRYLLILFLLLSAAPLMAAEMRIDKSVCQMVTRHHPDADVAYQPGVDVNGNAVAPADLSAPPDLGLEDSIRVKLTDDAARVFGLAVPTVRRGGRNIPLADPELEIGYVTLENGMPYLNGKPLDPGREEDLAVLCIGSK